jgi:hypothetical protein
MSRPSYVHNPDTKILEAVNVSCWTIVGYRRSNGIDKVQGLRSYFLVIMEQEEFNEKASIVKCPELKCRSCRWDLSRGFTAEFQQTVFST